MATRTVHAYASFETGGECKPWEYQARPLGAQDIEIKISHCGICGSDIHTIDSGWGPTTFPCVVGHEIIGTITQVGPSVKNLAVGDRVGVGAQVWACLQKDGKDACKECTEGLDSYCSKIVYTYNSKYADGAEAYGGYADYVRVLEHYAFKIPSNIPSDIAAPLLCAGVTVFTPLKQLNVRPGQRVGVVGIGGLGHLAIQFIKAFGAIPVAFSRSANKEAEVKSLGAEVFVNTSIPEQAEQAAGTVDVLLMTADALGMPINLYMSFLRARGTFVLLGVPNEDIKFHPFSLVGPGCAFIGSKIGSIQDVKDMLKLASEKDVRPVIQKLPMARVNEGIQLVRDGKVRYRVVLENPQ